MINAELREVLVDADLRHATRLTLLYLRITPDPQRVATVAKALDMDQQTISRSLAQLSERGLVRKVNGVWLPVLEER